MTFGPEGRSSKLEARGVVSVVRADAVCGAAGAPAHIPVAPSAAPPPSPAHPLPPPSGLGWIHPGQYLV